MTITDKYLFKKVFFGFIGTMLAFFFLYIIIDLFSNMQDFIRNKSTVEILARYYALNLPFIFVQVTPISFLLSALYTLSALNKSNEMVSLRTQGLSPLDIGNVLLVLALLVCTTSLSVDDKIVPRATIAAQAMGLTAERTKAEEKIIKNFHFYSRSGLLVFAHEYDYVNAKMTGVNMYQKNSSDQTTDFEMIAEEVTYNDDGWFARNASIYQVIDGEVHFEDAEPILTQKLEITETPDELVRKAKLEWSNLSLKEIRSQIDDLKKWKSAKLSRILRVEYHRKIAMNYALFFLLLGAFPFALRIQQRRAAMSAFALTLGLCFLYYFLFSFCVALGKSDLFPPWIAAWITNLFFGVSGLVGLHSVK